MNTIQKTSSIKELAGITLIIICCFPIFGQGKMAMQNSYQEKMATEERNRAALDGDWDTYFKQACLNENENIRRDTYGFLWNYAKKTKDIEKRKILVELLTKGLNDKSKFVYSPIYEWLMEFSPTDFNEQSRQILIAIPYHDNPPIIRLWGLINEYRCKRELEALVGTDEQKKSMIRDMNTTKWAACLVLARWGNPEALKMVLSHVKENNDLIALGTLLFKDLAFVRQPETVELLKTYLNSTERLPALKPTVQGTPLAFYAATALARTLEDFPVAEMDIEQSDLPRIKNWINDQKVLKIKKTGAY